MASYFGHGEPNCVDSFLKEFIDELDKLLKFGIVIHSINYRIELKCFICDRPARGFVKCIKSHTGYSSCERCTVVGQYFMHRIIFEDVNCTKRTNESFRSKEDPNHHLPNIESPFLKIQSINMIGHFVLDFMHLGYLGIGKKILTNLMNGVVKMSKKQQLTISQRLVNLSESITSDFQRTTRSLADLSKWKATEFRCFFIVLWPFCFKRCCSRKYL